MGPELSTSAVRSRDWGGDGGVQIFGGYVGRHQSCHEVNFLPRISADKLCRESHVCISVVQIKRARRAYRTLSTTRKPRRRRGWLEPERYASRWSNPSYTRGPVNGLYDGQSVKGFRKKITSTPLTWSLAFTYAKPNINSRKASTDPHDGIPPPNSFISPGPIFHGRPRGDQEFHQTVGASL